MSASATQSGHNNFLKGNADNAPRETSLVVRITGLELSPGMLGISPALVTLVPGTAADKAIPGGDIIYPRLCETVSDNYGKS